MILPIKPVQRKNELQIETAVEVAGQSAAGVQSTTVTALTLTITLHIQHKGLTNVISNSAMKEQHLIDEARV